MSDITGTTGSALNEIGLPDTVTVNLDDNSTAVASISGDGGTPSYDGNTVGTYIFTGALALQSGTINPDSYSATVNVIVGSPIASTKCSYFRWIQLCYCPKE